MSTPYNLERDLSGIPSYSPLPSVDLYQATLTNGNVTTVTVPSNFPYWTVGFSYQPGSTTWVSFTGTAKVPVGNTLASCNSSLMPGSRKVKAGTVISMITADSTADVGVEMYAEPT